MTTSNEHNNATAVLQGWVEQMLTDARCVFDVRGPETPQETRDVIEYVASWIAAYRDRFSATPAPAPAQEVGLTDEGPAHVAGLLEHRRELDAIEFFESTNRDSHKFKKSVRGTYVNPAVARDWKWFQLGMKHATEDES